MPEQRRPLKLAAKSAVLGLLAAGLVAAAATPAAADTEVQDHGGVSNTVFNCYTQHWDTAWNQMCGGTGADKAGKYESRVDCSLQGERDREKQRYKYETGWAWTSANECTYHADNPEIWYGG